MRSNEGAIERIEAGAVRGFLHRPRKPNGSGLVLTHGAGSDCAPTHLMPIEGAGHDLKRGRFDLAAMAAALMSSTSRCVDR